jgi:hypothetical protein
MEPGELLLLQLVKTDAARLSKLDSRVEFALVYDHSERDVTGAISRKHWPRAGKVWRYILVCRDTVPALPFSLEDLPLQGSYAGQTQCAFIAPADEAVIRSYVARDLQLPLVQAVATPRALLHAIRNYDTVLRLSPERVTNVSEHTRRMSDPWPGDALKTLYQHKCQICTQDFVPRYGVPLADTRFINSPASGGSLESKNRLVVCPNHNAIISATRALFDETVLAFDFPNGLTERLVLRDHFLS